MKQCLLKLLRPLNAFLILSQCAAAYTQCAAAYTHCAAAYTHCAAAYTHCAAAYMLCAAAYMVKVRIKLTQSNWAGAGTELGNLHKHLEEYFGDHLDANLYGHLCKHLYEHSDGK